MNAKQTPSKDPKAEPRPRPTRREPERPGLPVETERRERPPPSRSRGFPVIDDDEATQEKPSTPAAEDARR